VSLSAETSRWNDDVFIVSDGSLFLRILTVIIKQDIITDCIIVSRNG